MTFEIIYESPAQLLLPERLLLYALVYGLRPSVAVEIGTCEGGGALIICAAMDAAGHGQLVCVDPAPKVAQDHLARIAHRAVLFEGYSPEAISRVYELVGARFDLVFVDGNHSYEAVLKDIEATVQFLSPTGYLLFHDAHYTEVQEAIDEALRRFPLIDCGLLSMEPNPTESFYKDKPIVWGGLRLLRFSSPSGGSRDQEMLPVQITPTQTELDVTVSRIRERLDALSGWHGALIRKTCKLTYRICLKFSELVFR